MTFMQTQEEKRTVLLLRPSYDWDGAQANWLVRMHVTATPENTVSAAIQHCIATHYKGDAEPQDFAVLAIFPGHLDDLYDPEGD